MQIALSRINQSILAHGLFFQQRNALHSGTVFATIIILSDCSTQSVSHTRGLLEALLLRNFGVFRHLVAEIL